MKKKHIILLLFSVLMFNGCASLDLNKKQTDQAIEVMNSWIGSSKQELLLKWGAPANVTSDGNGGEILTFHEHDKIFINNTFLTRRYSYSFYLDANQKVYHGKYRRETL